MCCVAQLRQTCRVWSEIRPLLSKAYPGWGVTSSTAKVPIDVVEIDPGVTQVAHSHLGLSKQTKIQSYHMDGRQFVREKAQKQHYKIVIQDAVNDLSVPTHLMTKEYNEAIKATLTPDGAYLLTLIDSIERGQLWRAAVYTMRESFPYVAMLDPDGFRDTAGRHVYVIYGSVQPLDLGDIRAVAKEYYLKQDCAELFHEVAQSAFAALHGEYELPERIKNGFREPHTYRLEQQRLEDHLGKGRKIVLTDQYAPVDNLMGDVFRDRTKKLQR